MTYVNYPFSLPASILKLRSALQVAGAQKPNRLTKYGIFHILRVYSAGGSVVFESPELSEFSRLFRRLWIRSLEVPRPFKVVITTIYYLGDSRAIESSRKIKVKPVIRKNGVDLVPLPSDEQLRRIVSSNIRSVVRRVKPVRVRLPRSSTTLRPSPEVRTATLKHLEISNDVLVGNTTTTVEIYRRTWTGTRTPNFGRLKKYQLPVNNHSMNETRTQDFGLEISHIDFSSLNTPSPDCAISIDAFSSALGTGPGGQTPPSTPSHLALARNKAIKKLIEQSQNGIDANLAQDAFQVVQTAKTIEDSVIRIASSLRALKKGNIPLAVDLLWHGKSRKDMPKEHHPSNTKSLANNWLAMQYGWKPLLQDIDGSMRALADYYQSNPTVLTVRSASTVTKVEKFDLTRNASSIKIGTEVRKTTSTSKFAIRYRRSSPLVSFLAQTGFTNPINLAYEVLPFSFVLDWFVPIGPFLSSFSSWDGLEFVSGSEVNFTRLNTLKSCAYSGSPVFAHINEQYYGGWQQESVRLDRNALIGFPSLTIPEFKSPIDAHGVHIANGLALIRGIMKK